MPGSMLSFYVLALKPVIKKGFRNIECMMNAKDNELINIGCFQLRINMNMALFGYLPMCPITTNSYATVTKNKNVLM